MFTEPRLHVCLLFSGLLYVFSPFFFFLKGPVALNANVPYPQEMKLSKQFLRPGCRSRLLRYKRHRCDRPLQRPVGWEWRGAPVRLVEVDVKSPCPVGEDPLLCDEAVVAAPPPTLVRNVHGALVRPTWLVVVVRDGVVLRLPAVAVREQTVDI